MGTSLLALGVLAVVGFKFLTPEQRTGIVATVLTLAREIRAAWALNLEKCAPFYDALNERVSRPVLSLALIGLIMIVFAGMMLGGTPLSAPETLVRWGGNMGLRTTNGEWWRLVTSIFVHAGLLHVAVNMLALAQIGPILERLVGRPALAAVFVAAGIFGNLATLQADAVLPRVGASAAIAGLYGLLLGTAGWCALQNAPLKVPRVAVKRLTPALVLFLLYNLFSDSLTFSAKLTGFTIGAIGGGALGRGISEAMPPWRIVAAGAAASLVFAAALAFPLRSITDVRPEIGKLVAIESRAIGAYHEAKERFNKRKLTAEALADLIEQTIVPELKAAETRIAALDRVPREHEPLLAGAQEYLRLRTESWTLRIQGFRNTTAAPRRPERLKASATENVRRSVEARHTARMGALSNADFAERAAREALDKIKLAG